MNYEQLHRILVHVEDRRFYYHFGVDPIAIARAVVANLSACRYAQGGSTITQQLARMKYLSRDKTLRRKFKEIIIATWLEYTMTKKEILEVYCDDVYLGHCKSTGKPFHGFEDGAWAYYGKPVRSLSLAQTVCLVAAVKGPNWYTPGSFKNMARSALILGSLFETGIVSEVELNGALKEITI